MRHNKYYASPKEHYHELQGGIYFEMGVYIKISIFAESKLFKKKAELAKQFKFPLFSASAGLIQLISFALLHDVFKIPDYNACYLPSLILSVLWNFTFNRRYTFRSDGNVKRAMLLVALYYVVFITLSRWWSTELVALGVHDWLIEVINMLVNFVTEFLFQKFVVYRGTIDTNELAKKEQA